LLGARSSGLLAGMSASTPTEARPAPSTGLAVLAAALPVVFVVVACPLSVIALPGGPGSYRHAIQEAGVLVWLVFGSALVAAVVLAVLLALSSKGFRVPAVLAVGFAALPWLFGTLGVLLEMSSARAALEHADPEYRAGMMARAIVESTLNRFFGAGLSSALFAAVGLAFAIGGLAQRASERRGIGALLGGGSMLPLAGLAIVAMSAVRITSALEIALAAFGAVLATALGGFGIGTDRPHGRSGALGVAASIGAGLSLCAAVAAASSSTLMDVFVAMANADPASRGALLIRAAAEMGPLSFASMTALPLTLLAAAVLAVLAARRVRPTTGRIAGAAALVVLAAAIVGADAIVERRADALYLEAVSLGAR
jgi:hypothetical protein